MVPDFIPTGYTRTVGFYAVANVHNEFSFTYRPFSGPAGGEAFQACVGANGLDKPKFYAALKERLMGWSFERAIDDAALGELSGPIFEKLQGVIFGTRAPDFEVPAKE